MAVRLSVVEERFPVAGAFTISRGSRTEIRVVTATLSDGGFLGRGECVPYPRYGETAESVIALVRSVAIDLDNGLDRIALQDRLPPGAARNALDCAFWDLEAKRTATPVWRLAGLAEPRPAATAYTISLGAPEAMREKAAENADRPLLKIKLGSDGDLQRIQAVRAGAPNARLIVDANEGWTLAQYQALAPEFARLGVALVEQPLPAGDDSALAGVERPLPVCADESCHALESLPKLARKYDADQHQARQDRRAHRGAAAQAAGRGRGLSHHGRLHARHFAGDGAGLPADRRRRLHRPRRPAAARQGPGNADPLRGLADVSRARGAVGLGARGAGGEGGASLLPCEAGEGTAR